MRARNRLQGYFDEEDETKPRNLRNQMQNRKVKEIVKYAYENCEAFKARCETEGITVSDIKGIDDLQKIPVFRKDELIGLQKNKPPFGGLLGVPEEDLSWIYMSPGPIFDPVLESDDSWKRSIAMALYCCGFRSGDKVMNTWSYHMVPAGIWNDYALRHLGCTVIPSGTGNTELQAQILHLLRVEGFLGTTSFLMNILKKAEEIGLDPIKDFNLQVALVGGEAGGGPMRRIFEKDYGMVTGDFYGTADLGIIAHECKAQSGMHILDTAVVEITDPETGKALGPGEEGEVVVTNFNKSYPMIRFGTGDLSKLDVDECSCGRTSFCITKILGRIGDAIRVRGMFVHLNQVQQIVKDFNAISKCRVIVDRIDFRDRMILNLELKEAVSDKKEIEEAFAVRFKDVCRVTPDQVVFMEPGQFGDERGELVGLVDKREY